MSTNGFQYLYSAVIERLIYSNDTKLLTMTSDQITRSTSIISKFESSYAPNISIFQYFERINKHTKIPESCFIASLIYIDRLISVTDCLINNLNVHRVIITSILIATKFLEDEYFNNSFYAKIGGISTAEINLLEIEFLRLINFSLYVSPTSYSNYENELLKFSYSNLWLPKFDISYEINDSEHKVSSQEILNQNTNNDKRLQLAPFNNFSFVPKFYWNCQNNLTKSVTKSDLNISTCISSNDNNLSDVGRDISNMLMFTTLTQKLSI